MCPPALAAVMTGPAGLGISMGMSALEWKMQENAKKAARQSATHALRVQEQNLATREGEQRLSREIEEDKVRRKGAVARGQLLVGGAAKGTGGSTALQTQLNEFRARETEYMGALDAQASQQSLALGIERSANISDWQGRMMANKGTGLLGLGMALGKGAMQHQMAFGKSAAQAGMEGYAAGAAGPTPTHPMGDIASFQSSTNPYQWNFNSPAASGMGFHTPLFNTPLVTPPPGWLNA